MQLTGKLTKINPVVTIGSDYEKLIFIVQNKDGYEGADKDYSFEIFQKSDGDKIQNFKKYNSIGDTVTVKFEIDCRENPKKEGQWFTALKAWRVESDESTPKADDPTNEDVDDSF